MQTELKVTSTQIDADPAPLAEGTVAPSEWRFVFVTILIVLMVTSIPYMYAYFTAPPDKQFMGIMQDVPDHLQYFSWMRELTHAPLASNKLTPEPNAPVFFNLLWWGLGRLGNLLGVGYAGMFQLLRWVATPLFLLLAYRICSWFLPDRLMRRTAFLTVVFMSGFGWILILMKYALMQDEVIFPLTVYVAEPNTFLSILGYPHFVAAALYTFVFDLVLRGQAKGRLSYAVVAGVVALFLGWQHPYDLVLIYGILLAYALLLLLRDRRIPVYVVTSGVIIGVISVWPAIYSVVLTSLDPLWKEVLAQFANAGVYTPNLLLLPLLLGPAFLLALYTAIRQNPFRLRGQSNNTLFLRAWFWGNFLLIYLPADFQIHMLNGWQLPIAILATLGLFTYVAPLVERRQWFQRRWSPAVIRRGLAILLILVVVPTNLYLFAWRFVELRRHDYPYYLHTNEVQALQWLEANAQPDDVVFSSLDFGQYVPAMTGTHAFLAHWAQTVDFYGKSDMVSRFYATETPAAERTGVLDRFSVDYILYGPTEHALGGYNPADVPGLKPVFVAQDVTIYERSEAAQQP